jgi:hypothetical protein
LCPESYSTALKKCDTAQFTTDLSSAESGVERKKRRERCRILPSDNDDTPHNHVFAVGKAKSTGGSKVQLINFAKPAVPSSLLMRSLAGNLC